MMQSEQMLLPEVLNFEGLERRANYRVIAFREDVLIAFERKDAAAIIYNIVSRWEEVKRDEILKEIDQRRRQGLPPLTEKEIEERLWVYMSYNDFARESGGAVSYNTVIAMIAYLVNEKKALLQRENHDPRFSDYEYRINKETMRELLRSLPVKPPTYTKVGTAKKKEKSSTKVGIPSTKNGTRPTNSGRATTENGRGVYQSWGTSHITHSNPQDTHNNHTEENGADANASHPHHALSPSDIEHRIRGAIAEASNAPWSQGEITEQFIKHVIDVLGGPSVQEQLRSENKNREEMLPDDDRTTDPCPDHSHSNGVTGGISHRDTSPVESHQQASDNSYSPTRQHSKSGEEINGSHPTMDRGRSHRPGGHGGSLGADVPPAITEAQPTPRRDLERTATDQQPATATVTSTSVREVTQASTPVVVGGNATRAGGKGRAKGDAPATGVGGKTPDIETMAWGARKCLLKFDARRGAPLLVKYQLQQANQTAKALSAHYTEQQVDTAIKVMEADPYYADKVIDIFDVARRIAEYLKRAERKQQPAKSPEPTDGPRYKKLPVPPKKELERIPVSTSYAKLPPPPVAMGGAR